MKNDKEKDDYFFTIKKKKQRGEKKQVSIYLYQNEIDKLKEMRELTGHDNSYLVRLYINECHGNIKVVK